MSNLNDAIATLVRCSNDAALLSSIKVQLQASGLWKLLDLPEPIAHTDGPPPLIPTTELTAIQCAVFDNHIEPRGKPPGNRYGCALEIWTENAEDIRFGKRANYAHKSSFPLYDAKALKEAVRTLKRPGRTYPLDAMYLDFLGMLTAAELEGRLIGLVSTTVDANDERYAPGRFYHPFQFVLVQFDDGRPSDGRLMLEPVFSSSIDLGEFDENDAAGKPLGFRVIGQSRTDLCGLSHGSWATNERMN